MTPSTDPGAPRDAELSAARVLVVDDDLGSLRLLEVVLRRMGISDIRPLSDPAAIGEELSGNPPDLVLMDWHIPQLTGPEVLAMIRSRQHEDDFLPVVILTADATPEARDAALSGGADDFLVKPFDVSEVRLRVRNLLRARGLHVRLTAQRRELSRELLEHEERAIDHERWLRAKAERVRACLAPGGLTIVYQPVADLTTGLVVGAEALSRFAGEPYRTPDRWFADAAEVGLGQEMELAAVRAALDGLDRLPEAVWLSLNVSAPTVAAPALADLLGGASSRRLVVELTEHEPIEDYQQISSSLGYLRSLGVRLAVDDAGAGFASLRHILRLGPEVIKLDIALTRGIASDPVRRALASALVAFASEVGANIVAEGIESAAEADTLRRLGIRFGQGYHLARPMPLPLPAMLEGAAG